MHINQTFHPKMKTLNLLLQGQQCPEERSSLKYLLRFTEFQETMVALPESVAVPQSPAGAESLARLFECIN